MTKIEQKIPEGWSIDEFGKLALLSKKKYIPSPNEHIKCIELEHFEKETGRINGYIDSAQQSSTKNYFKKGDVLYGKLRPYLKKYTLASFDGICSTEIWVLQGCKEKLTNFYLYLIIQSNKFNIACNVSTGTHMPRADWEYVSSIPFILPPLPEQEKIAEILSCWDDGIEKLSALIEKKKIQKKALMQQLLTGKHHLKGFKEPWIDVDLASILQYEQPSKYLVDEVLTYNKNKIPVLTANKAFILGSTNDTEGVYNKGDCIIFDDFTTDIKYVDFPFKIKSSAIKILTPLKAETNLKFVFEQMKRIKYPLGGHKRYYLSEFQYLPISLPCPAEQKTIAEILSKADEEIELLNKKLEAFKQEKKALMQQLLTGKIRVKVN